MLLGLVAAAILATLLQLIALRAKRAEAFELAANGIIHMRCWVVVETPAAASVASLRAAALLALPAPARRPEPLRFVGEMRMMPQRAPVRRPAPVRPMVYASVKRFRYVEAGRFVLDDMLAYAPPPEAAWSLRSRAPPPVRRTPAAAPPLH